MKTTLVLMLSALLCTLATCVNVMPPADFDLEQMRGKWYMVGLATNAQWFVSHKATMKMGTIMVDPTAEGDLSGTSATLNADGTCSRMARLGQKTETPGRFSVRAQPWNIDYELRVVDVVYDSYVIALINKTTAGDESEVINKFFSRSPDVNATLQNKFVNFSLDTGVLRDNILILPMNGECPHTAT